MVLRKGAQGEDQRNQLQPSVQVPGDAGGLRKRHRGSGGPAYGVHPVMLAKWKRYFSEHGAEVFRGKEVKA